MHFPSGLLLKKKRGKRDAKTRLGLTTKEKAAQHDILFCHHRLVSGSINLRALKSTPSMLLFFSSP